MQEDDYNNSFNANQDGEEPKLNAHGFKYPKRAREHQKWNQEDDEKLLLMIDKLNEKKKVIDWSQVARGFQQHPFNVKQRYNQLQQDFIFTKQQEELIVELATKYFDQDETPDWAAISQQVRNKPAKQCEKRYYAVMREFWNEENTNQMLDLVNKRKLKNLKVDFKEIGQQLQGRPAKVVEQWYQVQINKK